MADVVFHLPRSWLGPLGSGLLPFYERLTEGLRDRGVGVAITALNRERVEQQITEEAAAVHVINHGRVQHPRAWNAGIAYVYPFWNMDPAGIRAFSSIGQIRFRPADIDPEIARPFFRQMRQRLLGKRTSRYEQPAGVAPVPQGAVAVFLQSEAHRMVGETCYLDRWEMLRSTCAATDGPVVVKPHPRDQQPETRAMLQDLQSEFPHLEVFDGNIHDALSAARKVVTINSAVGIEAYLHRKPVILCGQSDFHHIADTARSTDDLRQLLQAEPKKRAFDKFIWWYFGHHCLSTTEPDLTSRFMARVGLT